MYFVSTLICTGVTLLIAHGAYRAIVKAEPALTSTSELSPEELLKKVYRSAYFTHFSLADEARENVEEKTNDY